LLLSRFIEEGNGRKFHAKSASHKLLQADIKQNDEPSKQSHLIRKRNPDLGTTDRSTFYKPTLIPS
jgi:hypothetical protein